MATSDDIVLALGDLTLTGEIVDDVVLLDDDSFTVLPLRPVARVHHIPNTSTDPLPGTSSTGTAVLPRALAAAPSRQDPELTILDRSPMMPGDERRR